MLLLPRCCSLTTVLASIRRKLIHSCGSQLFLMAPPFVQETIDSPCVSAHKSYLIFLIPFAFVTFLRSVAPHLPLELFIQVPAPPLPLWPLPGRQDHSDGRWQPISRTQHVGVVSFLHF